MNIFIIMPFSKTTKKHDKRYWDRFYNKIHDLLTNKNVKTLKQYFDTDTIRVHRASAPQGNIVKSIIRDLKESDIVIAILTDHNPNVLYELGIRHSIKPNTIMLSQQSKKIPFDLNNYGVGLYADNRKRYKEIEKELLQRLKQISEDPNIPDNPYLDHYPKETIVTESKRPNLKIELLDQKDVSYKTNRFYREMRRTSEGKRDYSGRTIFSTTIEIWNYTKDNIAIVSSELVIVGPNIKKDTQRLYMAEFIESEGASVHIKPIHKKKVLIGPRGIYEASAAFIFNFTMPKNVDKIQGHVKITDMDNKKYQSNDIQFIEYR